MSDKREGKLPITKVVQVKNIMKHLLKANDEYIEQWLDSEIPMFDGKKPRALIEEGKGAEVVAALSSLLPNGRPNA